MYIWQNIIASGRCKDSSTHNAKTLLRKPPIRHRRRDLFVSFVLLVAIWRHQLLPFGDISQPLHKYRSCHQMNRSICHFLWGFLEVILMPL